MEKGSKQREAVERIHATIGSYQRTFETEDGYKVLIDLMRQFNMMRPSFYGEKPIEMAYSEGGRNVVCYILSKCKMNMVGLEQLIEGANDV